MSWFIYLYNNTIAYGFKQVGSKLSLYMHGFKYPYQSKI